MCTKTDIKEGLKFDPVGTFAITPYDLYSLFLTILSCFNGML